MLPRPPHWDKDPLCSLTSRLLLWGGSQTQAPGFYGLAWLNALNMGVLNVMVYNNETIYMLS